MSSSLPEGAAHAPLKIEARGSKPALRGCVTIAAFALPNCCSGKARAPARTTLCHPTAYCLQPHGTCHMDMILGECVCALSLINKQTSPLLVNTIGRVLQDTTQLLTDC